MSRYRKIEVRTWADENFRDLSPMPPSGQGLWFYLLTGPQTSQIPGLYRAGRAAMAEELGWAQEDFDQAFNEIAAKGMVMADFSARLVWLPNAMKHNEPESPNVVRSWRVELDLLPECPLKRTALAHIRGLLQEKGPSFAEAFDEILSGRKGGAKPSPKASPKPSPEALVESGAAAAAGSGTGKPAAPCTAADLSIAMRAAGVEAQPAHPHLIALAEQGVTPDTVRLACEEARRAKPAERIGMAYVISILRRWSEAAGALQVAGVTGPPPRASPGRQSARDASRMAAAAGIGLSGNQHGINQDDDAIDVECHIVAD
jgi:hypothetical protein